MKLLRRFVVAKTLTSFLLFAPPSLGQDTTYKVDMNRDGKKETITYTSSLNQVVSINDPKKYYSVHLKIIDGKDSKKIDEFDLEDILAVSLMQTKGSNKDLMFDKYPNLLMQGKNQYYLLTYFNNRYVLKRFVLNEY